MPSPIGHALGGLAAGWAVEASAGRPSRVQLGTGLAYAGLGMAPDLDLLSSLHRGPTHSLAAALVVGVVVLAVGWYRDRDAGRLASACAAAWGSHVLLDWLGTDTSAPAGIMALWPVSRAFVEAPVHVFLSVSRRYGEPGLFWVPNLIALVRELAVLVPAVVLVGRWRRRRVRAAP